MPDLAPRELLVVRHAKSSWSSAATTDRERPLAPRGRKDAPRMGAWLAEQDWRPDAVIASPATRARETAESVLEAMRLSQVLVRVDKRFYGASLGTALDVLADAPETARRVMVVGHNPTLEEIVRWLAREEPQPGANGKLMPTCAVARLAMPETWRGMEPGSARLLGIYRPKEVLI